MSSSIFETALSHAHTPGLAHHGEIVESDQATNTSRKTGSMFPGMAALLFENRSVNGTTRRVTRPAPLLVYPCAQQL
jgi:hypothetical protein